MQQRGIGRPQRRAVDSRGACHVERNALRTRIEGALEKRVSVRALSFAEAARRIAEDACDVVVDIAGWTAGTRSPILAARPAPTQVQWLGFAGTMG